MNTRSLRTPETEKEYQEYLLQPKKIKCCFCRELRYDAWGNKTAITKHWKHWVVMYNEFPYDKVYSKHDLLFPKRHVDKDQLTLEEWAEYEEIRKELDPLYHQLIKNLGDRISQPGHYHIHLCLFHK